MSGRVLVCRDCGAPLEIVCPTHGATVSRLVSELHAEHAAKLDGAPIRPIVLPKPAIVAQTPAVVPEQASTVASKPPIVARRADIVAPSRRTAAPSKGPLDHKEPTQKSRILAYLASRGSTPSSSADVAEAIGTEARLAGVYLCILQSEGLIHRVGRGQYTRTAP